MAANMQYITDCSETRVVRMVTKKLYFGGLFFIIFYATKKKTT